MPEPPIRIKRYPNRRFYASHTSSYVSLADIEELVRSGKDVEIVDNQTGEDLTRTILVQVIAERHPDKMALLPSAMLHAMLRTNDVMTGFLADYFRNSLSYIDYIQQHGSSGPLAQPVHWMKAWLERWSKPTGEAPQGDVPAAGASAAEAPPESEAVAERIRQLEQRLATLEKKDAKR